MNHRNRLLRKGIVALFLLWGIAYGVVRWAGSVRVTPEKVAAFVEGNPLAEVEDPEERKSIIGTLATMLNELEASEVRVFEQSA